MGWSRWKAVDTPHPDRNRLCWRACVWNVPVLDTMLMTVASTGGLKIVTSTLLKNTEDPRYSTLSAFSFGKTLLPFLCVSESEMRRTLVCSVWFLYLFRWQRVCTVAQQSTRINKLFAKMLRQERQNDYLIFIYQHF